MDALAGETDETVWVQTGHATVRPSHASYRRFFPETEYRQLFWASRAIVAHAGLGTLLEAARARKPLVCLPRLRRYGEHWDDHQLEICAQLSESGTLHYVQDPEDLNWEALARAEAPVFPGSGTGLADRIMSFLEEEANGGSSNSPHL